MALELTTIAAIQSYLSDSSLTSTVLLPYANAAEDMIANYCNRRDESGNHWLSATRTEYFRSENTLQIVLRWSPVTAISAISTVDSVTTAGVESTTALDLANFSIDGKPITAAAFSAPAGIISWRRSSLSYFVGGCSWPYIGTNPRRFPSFGYGDIKVAYTGGYATAPPSLERAATILASTMYRNKSQDPTVQSERLGEFSQTFKVGGAESWGSLPAEVARLVQPYVRVGLP